MVHTSFCNKSVELFSFKICFRGPGQFLIVSNWLSEKISRFRCHFSSKGLYIIILPSCVYTLYSKMAAISVLLFSFKLSLVTSFLNLKLKKKFPWTRQQELICMQTKGHWSCGHFGIRCIASSIMHFHFLVVCGDLLFI